MPLFEIKSRYSGSVLFSLEYGKFRLHECDVIGVKELDYDRIFQKAKPKEKAAAVGGGK